MAFNSKSLDIPGSGCRNCDRHGLDSKLTRAMLCSWERHLSALSTTCRSYVQSILNFSCTSIKLKKKNTKVQLVSNILASPEAGRYDCLP